MIWNTFTIQTEPKCIHEYNEWSIRFCLWEFMYHIYIFISLSKRSLNVFMNIMDDQLDFAFENLCITFTYSLSSFASFAYKMASWELFVQQKKFEVNAIKLLKS